MELFLWPPNWRAKVVERIEWLTDVQQSSNGTEVRRSLRAAPRTSISYEVIVEGVESQKLKNFIRKNQGKEVQVPWWLGGFKKWEVSPSFGRWAIYSELGLRPQDMGFSTGLHAIFFHSGTGQHDIQEVTAASATNLTITGGNSYPVGSMVYPFVKVYFSSSQTLSLPTDSTTRMQITFDLVEPLPISGEHSVEAWKVGSDIGTFIDEPNRVEDVTEEFQRLVQELDFQTGLRSFTDQSKQSFTLRSHEYVYPNRVDAFFFKNFLHLLQGRHRTVTIPTWGNDLTFYGYDDEWDSSVFIIRDQGLRQLSIQERAGQYLLFVGALNDPNYAFIDKIWSVDDVYYTPPSPYHGRDEWSELLHGQLEGMGAINQIPRHFFNKMSWLERARLNTDSIEIVWESSEVATVTLPFRSIRR